ncbi:ABC transporter ATP-binding protein [Parafrigoribacterium mesophilum]|uniref:ABC transporter ATP-binding protein n=1 Tax=Parafrigoribacterium mesophilum TaxID=433646 RepID=UPI0031FE0385
MLNVENVVVRYGALEALHGVSIDVPSGEFVAILGRNGAGKSSLVGAISGMLPLSAGSVRHDGERIDGRGPTHVVRDGIAVVPEGRQLFGTLTVSDNLRLGAYGKTALGLGGFVRSLLPKQPAVEASVIRVLDLLPELKELLAREAGTLSGGQQQMVAVGRALMADPSVLLVDELSLGLAPIVVHRLLEHLESLNEKGMSIVLIEQNITLALRASRTAYVLEGGVVRFYGPSAELARDGKVLTAYLGVEAAA